MIPVSKELQDLTNKFIGEFLEIANEGKQTDSLYHFHYTLADAIANSNYPNYKEITSLMLGMSEFDTNIMKAFMTKRVQGFTKKMEDRLTRLDNQEDYLVEDVIIEEKEIDDKEYDWDIVDGKMVNFRLLPTKTKTEVTKFKVINTRNTFKGSVVYTKYERKDFINENDYKMVMKPEKITFYNDKGVNIMNIDIDNYGNESINVNDFSAVKDINSFYLILCCL